MSESQKIPDKVKIVYDRTPSYKTYRVDGAHGGITPRGDIFLDLYHEVTSPPKSEIRKVEPNGKIGKNLEVEKDGDIKRLIECAISMDINTAMQIKNWLEEKIKQHQAVSNQPKNR